MSEKMLIIVDFDGTVTDIDEETKSFRREFLRRMANMLDLDYAAFEQNVCDHERLIEEHPEKYGFVRNGRIVAPSNADPYILPYEAIRLIMHEMNKWPDDDAIQTILFGVYDSVIGSLNQPVIFRKGVGELFFSMQPESAYIVSGSSKGLLQHKIRTLGPRFRWLLLRTRGSAKKYDLADQLPDVPETFEIPGYYRPIFIRRHRYYKILEELRQEHHVEWNNVLVIGDIFEADGALPFALGARFALMLRQGSLQHEVDFLRSHERGMVISSLDEARELLIR